MLEVEPSGRRGHRKWLKRAGRSLSFRRHRGDILFHFNHLCNSLQSLIIHKNLKRFENQKKIINLSRLGRHDSLAPLWVRHWLINNCRCASFHRGSAVCIAVSDVTFLSIDGLCKADKLARFSHLPSLIFWVSGGGASLRLGHSVQQLFTRHEEMKSSNLSLASVAGSNSFACDLYLEYISWQILALHAATLSLALVRL